MNLKNITLDWIADERRSIVYHKEDGRTYIESRQDVEPILEFVKNKAELPEDKDFKYIGEIPKYMLDKALIEGWADDAAQWRKWFADNPKFSAKWHR
jgi:hypothetical protein